MTDLTKKPIDEAHTSNFLKTSLHAVVWFAHKAGAALADIERVFAEVIADVKAEAAAEISEVRQELNAKGGA